ncbi:hypothetical protein AB0J90_15605 [Micromonospora sp. NPDC049523]|uniref:hypothetical protein n=1 Tax=Micromonospora sp. NPDC049523 TaxID=3155921 RepID=UPI003435F42D
MTMDLAYRADTGDREVRVADRAPGRYSEPAAARRSPERKAQVVAMAGQVFAP